MLPSKDGLIADGTASLTFWGVRGSIPTPGPSTIHYGGNTTCVELRADGELIILDAGTGIRLLGRKLLAESGERPIEATLLLTHTHWDHIQGLPFFLPVYQPQNHLRILGYEGARKGLRYVLSGQMERPYFPIGMHDIPANLRIEELRDMAFRLGKVRVRACFAKHPGVCVGYRLDATAGSVAFFPDNELCCLGADGAPDAELGRAEHEKLVAFLRSVDVLIMDTQYDKEEYGQHIGWGHGCVDGVVALAVAAGVKRLFLFHHDPDHDDATVTRMVEHARSLVPRGGAGAGLRIDAAREGLSITLRPGN